MPTDSSGTYVPLSQFTKAEIVNYVGNILTHGEHANAELYLRIGERYNVDQHDQLVLQRLIRNARDEIEAGDIGAKDPNVPVTEENIPNVPSEPGHGTTFIYDTLINVVDPITGAFTWFSERFEFPTPVSESDIRSYIDSNRNQFLRAVSPVPFPESTASRLNFEVIIKRIGHGTED